MEGAQLFRGADLGLPLCVQAGLVPVCTILRKILWRSGEPLLGTQGLILK